MRPPLSLSKPISSSWRHRLRWVTKLMTRCEHTNFRPLRAHDVSALTRNTVTSGCQLQTPAIKSVAERDMHVDSSSDIVMRGSRETELTSTTGAITLEAAGGCMSRVPAHCERNGCMGGKWGGGAATPSMS